MNDTAVTSPKGNSRSSPDPPAIEDQTPTLVRYYIIGTFVALATITVAIGVVYGQLSRNRLINQAESDNVAYSKDFQSSVWPQFKSYVAHASELDSDELPDQSETAELRQAIEEEMDDPSVAGLALYDTDGLIVFSSDASEIGEFRTSDGFVAATRRWYWDSTVTTELIHFDTFEGFEGTIRDRDLATSYVPIKPNNSSAPVAGVIQIYRDVTPELQQLRRTQRAAFGGVLGFLILIAGLVFFARRSPRQSDLEGNI